MRTSPGADWSLVASLNNPRMYNLNVTAGQLQFLNFTDSVGDGEEFDAVARLAPGQAPPAVVNLTGTVYGRPFSRQLEVTNVQPKADYLPRMHAKLEIDRLVAQDAQANHDKIVSLSKEMYVMSPFTSLLVLENEEMYKQYNVDRGRKDHWAMYPCPAKIDVVTEPLRTRPSPVSPFAHPQEDLGVPQEPSTQPSGKPSIESVLATIVVRPRSSVLMWPPGGASGWGTGLPGTNFFTPIQVQQNSTSFTNMLGTGFGVSSQVTHPSMQSGGTFLDDIQANFLLNAPHDNEAIRKVWAGDVVLTRAQREMELIHGEPDVAKKMAQWRKADIERLTREAKKLIVRKEYGKSIDVIEQIRVLDPHNEWVEDHLEMLKELEMLRERQQIDIKYRENEQLQTDAIAQTEIPWFKTLTYPEDWPAKASDREVYALSGRDASTGVIREKYEVTSGSGSEADRHTQAKLQERIPKLDFEGTELSSVVTFLREMSGVNMNVNWDAMAKAGVGRNARVSVHLADVTLRQALRTILSNITTAHGPLSFVVDDGVIDVSTREELSQKTIIRIYDVNDLITRYPMFSGPILDLSNSLSVGEYVPTKEEIVQKIISTIKGAVEPDSWKPEGTVGIINDFNGSLTVLQTADAQAKVADVLEQLRQNRSTATFTEMLGLHKYDATLTDNTAKLNVNVNTASYDTLAALPWPSALGEFVELQPTNDWSAFTDLLAFCPGMNTSVADVQAVLEEEADCGKVVRGNVDPKARHLLEAARQGAWRVATLPRQGLGGETTVSFTPSGCCRIERILGSGLREVVICDGRKLFHLYPELAIGASAQPAGSIRGSFRRRFLGSCPRPRSFPSARTSRASTTTPSP